MFPMGLSMLWESTDPQQALQERFGLDSFEAAVGRLTRALEQIWAIDVRACDRIIISASNAIAWIRTDRAALVAKWSRARDQFDRFTAIADLLQALHHRGVPVPPPLAAADGRLRVIVDSGSVPLSMTVQPLIEGDLLDTTDASAVRQAGACLASLHRALAVHPDGPLIDTTPPPDLRLRMAKWLEREDPGTAPGASTRLRDQLGALPPLDSAPQLIHNDYRASNIIMARSQVRAVIDFDEVGWDHCVKDLANSFVRLGTHFRHWQPTPASVRRSLLEGYESVRPLTPSEHRWLDAIALWYGIQAVPIGADPAGWGKAL